MTDDETLQSELKRRTRFSKLLHAASCDSTQDLAAAEATDTHGSGDAVFWADHQTRGRGRQQRVWDDDSGLDLAVTFRVTVRLPEPILLPAALPVAVLRACEPFAGARLRIKWPNDVYAGDRKLSGVLIDRDSARPHTYRIGIGINVNRTRFPAPLAATATSLRLLRGREHRRADVLLALAEQVDAMLGAIVAGGDVAGGDIAGYEHLFRERLALLGRDVSVTAGETIEGQLTSIDFERLVLDGQRAIPLAIVTRLMPRSE
jgi:BirA family biotin operon repressor/biotin-[acetyl-CoA-carboxylase] ligase